MEIKICVPDYNPDFGLKFKWEPNFDIDLQCKEGSIILSANKAGLVSLANHLLNLAQDAVPLGYHIHLDDTNALDSGSQELIVQKK